MANIGAEPELMASAHPAQVIGDAVRRVLPLSKRRAAACDVEGVGDAQRELIGWRVAVHLHADIARAEKPRVLAASGFRRVVVDTECVDKGRTQDLRMAENQRVELVVRTSVAG